MLFLDQPGTPRYLPPQVPFLEAARFAQENDLMFLEVRAMRAMLTIVTSK